MNIFKKLRQNSGFTLIELLVVIAIIAMLASVVLASLNTARQKGRDAKRIADLKQVQLALELHFDANSQYPAADAGNTIKTIRKRKDRSRIVKEKSFLNQLIFVYKNWSDEYSLATKIKTFIFHLEYFLFALLFEPYLLKQIKVFFQMKTAISQKRKNMPRRIESPEMEQWFV